ncbi:MAG: orotate phosphoribosyltransferase [Planctomycetota bacterium]|nr:orotate phosphoribosyltransferase [Planctomycetota bacterium]
MDVEMLKESLKSRVDDAVQKGDFTLASGAKSTYYIDGKLITLDQKGAHLVSQILYSLISGMDCSAIGGPSIGADPMVSTVGHICFENGKPLKMFYIRKEEKKHGAQKWIEGPPLDKEDIAVLFEDVLTSGKTVIDAVKRVREVGAKVSNVFCIVDRQAGGEDALKKEGIELISIFTAEQLGLG